ncbi:DUF6065 family protein [Stella sp.]|uniref:DUF6065 family protein n=1 Tax=Stella sp. TaxID=2912054 RepID=UPI0035B4E2D8
MKLDCYATGGVACEIVPAPQDRAWMDASPERYPYRCLPLNIANAFGWHLLAPCAIDIEYTGGPDRADIRVAFTDPVPGLEHFCQSHFARGVLTFHPGYLFRTEPGWNLLVGGPLNWPKDGIQPLTGIVETDWLPFPFTMNWQMTRAGRVRFEKGEPFCQIVPVPAGGLEGVVPTIRSIDADPELKAEYEAYRDRRTEFLRQLAEREPEAVREGWQKFYFRGRLPTGTRAPVTHASKLRLAEAVDTRPAPPPEPEPAPAASVAAAGPAARFVPPSLSRRPAIVSLRRHDGIGVTRSELDFAAARHLMPLGGAEIEPASNSYPVCFTLDPPGAVAVVGGRAGDNLFVAGKTWAASTYVPAVVRQYPFSVQPEGPDRRWTLCVDEACPWLGRDGAAKLIAGGRLTDLGKAGATVAEALMREQVAAAALVAALAERRLLVPVAANQDHPIAARPDFAHLLVVDHVRYGALPSALAEDWRRRGWSALVAAHVRSLGNWRRLAEREQARNPAGVPA